MSHHGKSAEQKWVYNPQYNSAMLLWIAWKHEKDPTKMSQLTRKYERSSDFVDFSFCLMIWRKVGLNAHCLQFIFLCENINKHSHIQLESQFSSKLNHPICFFLKWCKYFMPTEILIQADSLCQKFSHLWPHFVSKIPLSHLWQKGYSISGEHLGSSSRGAPPSTPGFLDVMANTVDGWNPK